jgi:basic amino acid/polyamine antiporter, APA family
MRSTSSGRSSPRGAIILAIVDFSTQLLLVIVGGALVFSAHTLVSNVHLGTAPHWKDFLIAVPVGMIAYTGIETISNMAEEAKDEARTIPAAIKRVVVAVFAIYAALPAVALSALPVRCVAGHCQTLLGVSEDSTPAERGQRTLWRRSLLSDARPESLT